MAFLVLLAVAGLAACNGSTTTTVSKPKEPVAAGEPVTVGKWIVAAGGNVTYKEKIGDQYLSKKADSGYTFALIPVAVGNNSNKTESLGLLISWTLKDGAGLEYKVETGADFYLAEGSRLDVTGVPPEAIRKGVLVFQVKKGAADLVLTFLTTVGTASWRIN